jgi:hypothetical protein
MVKIMQPISHEEQNSFSVKISFDFVSFEIFLFPQLLQQHHQSVSRETEKESEAFFKRNYLRSKEGSRLHKIQFGMYTQQ